jgi:hypothetical protein
MNRFIISAGCDERGCEPSPDETGPFAKGGGA